jgi:hypothetical protein
METEIINKHPRKRTGLIILIIIVFAFVIYYAIMSILGPGRAMDRISNEFILKKDEKNKIDERIFSDPAYLKILKERAFLQSRIAMAESDSLYLTINLADSTANLEIYGVVVHKAKIRDIRMSNILRKGNEYIISSLLSAPFTIENSISSIEKEPLLIKMAPKDTSEYRPDVVPDTAKYEPVSYILELNHGIRLYVYQNEKLKSDDHIHLFKFDIHNRVQNTINSLKNVMAFKVPEYHPFIKIYIPRTDAKIFYRAIPRHGQIAIYR